MISCGHCQGKHATVAEVRACSGAYVSVGGLDGPLPNDPNLVKPGPFGTGATDKQIDYIKSLATTRAWDQPSTHPDNTTVIRHILDGGSVSRYYAAAAINYLKHWCPIIARPDDPAGRVPSGKYAVADEDGVVRFYDVDKPTDGRWKGWTFLSSLTGAPGSWRETRVPRATRDKVLAAIADDVEGSARLFGQKHQACGQCGSPLSNVRSRAAGYGETCAEKRGWYYPSEEAARATLNETTQEALLP
jgi:hypothetical protein